jgi:DNA repair protein RadC
MEDNDQKKRCEGHRGRLRDRFIEGGIDRFSDEEVVEFFLTLGTPRKDVKIQNSL